MSLNYIKIKNFRNFEGETQIYFNDKLNVIVGNNGTGKTNIVNAISWCLYGEEIVNEYVYGFFGIINKNSDDVCVECGFTIEGKDFVVSRKYSNNKSEIIMEYDEKLLNVEELIFKKDFINNYCEGEFPIDLNELSKEDIEKLNQLMSKYFIKDNFFVKNRNLYVDDNMLPLSCLSREESLIIFLFIKFVTINRSIPLILDQTLAMLNKNGKQHLIELLKSYNSQIILLISEGFCNNNLEKHVVCKLEYSSAE